MCTYFASAARPRRRYFTNGKYRVSFNRLVLFSFETVLFAKHDRFDGLYHERGCGDYNDEKDESEFRTSI